MTVRVRVVSDRIPEIRREYQGIAEQAVAKAALDVEGGAKKRIREHDLIDTGTLLNSVHAEKIAPFRWKVTVGASYGIFHEVGTRTIPARPFLIPAAEDVRPKLMAAIEELVRRSAR